MNAAPNVGDASVCEWDVKVGGLRLFRLERNDPFNRHSAIELDGINKEIASLRNPFIIAAT